MLNEHAILPPSASEQWGNCGGWYQATRGFPNPETLETRSGTASHWVFSEGWNQKRDAFSFLDEVAPNGYVIDEEACEGAAAMLADIHDIHRRLSDDPGLLVFCEFRVWMHDIHDECWGTTDFGFYSPRRRLIIIVDYKSGHSSHSAIRHKQLVLYGKGIANHLGIDGLEDQRTRMQFRIVQPFSYRGNGPVDVWNCMLSDLRADFNILRMKAIENLSLNPTMSSGRWCRHCPAVGVCQAARVAGYNMIDATREPFGLDDMNSADLSVEYNIIADGMKLIEARKDALKAELEHRVKNGDYTAGLALETGPESAMKWKVPKEQVIALGQQFGVDLSTVSVITPKQAINLVPAPQRLAFESVLKSFTERTPGKLKLTPVSETLSGRAFSRRENDADV